MIIIPGFVISTLTFPGVILHEMAHKFFCDYYGVAVFKVEYFRISSKAGHVIHEPIFDPDHNAAIGLAPLVVNSIACMVLLTPYVFIWSFGTSFMWQVGFWDMFLIWVGISCGLSALPSKADLKHVSKDISAVYAFASVTAKGFNFLESLGAMLWMFLLTGFCYCLVSIIGAIVFLN